MKGFEKWAVFAATALVAVLNDSPAHAGTSGYSIYFVIDKLETVPGGYDIYPGSSIAADSTNDPAGCLNDAFQVPRYVFKLSQLQQQEDRELLTRTLLSAFLAGRKVKLWVHGSSCVTSSSPNNPYYYGVLLDKDE